MFSLLQQVALSLLAVSFDTQKVLIFFLPVSALLLMQTSACLKGIFDTGSEGSRTGCAGEWAGEAAGQRGGPCAQSCGSSRVRPMGTTGQGAGWGRHRHQAFKRHFLLSGTVRPEGGGGEEAGSKEMRRAGRGKDRRDHLCGSAADGAGGVRTGGEAGDGQRGRAATAVWGGRQRRV